MKKIIYFLGVSIAISSCASSCLQKSSSEKEVVTSIDSVRFYRTQVDSLKSEIKELEEQLDVAQDILQMREGEISYWGHKYDSCMVILQKRK